MNSWKKQWKEELDAVVPALRDDVKDAPIVVSQREEKSLSFWEKLNAWINERKKRFYACLATGVAAVVILCVALPILLRGAPTAVNAIALEINPKVVFALDEKGIVTSVSAVNADADVILSDVERKKSMEGKPASEATKIFVDYASRLGYLDLSNQDAVRISSCAEDIADVESALQSYFREKGAYAVVVSETLSAEQFCDRIGLGTLDSASEIVEKLSDLPTLYAERLAESKTLAELQAIYKEEVQTHLKCFLEKELEKLEANTEAIERINALNDEIRSHEDNPHLLLMKDYWSVLDCDYSLCMQNPHEYTAEFSALMTEMGEALTAYQNVYGERIESESKLTSLYWSNAAQSLQQFVSILADFSLEAFQTYFDFFSEVLTHIGVDISALTEICEIPQSVEEYLTETKEYAKSLYNALEEKYRAVYEEIRSEIKASDYEKYVEGIKAEYGSLSEYWNRLENN